jgi:glycosidase
MAKSLCNAAVDEALKAVPVIISLPGERKISCPFPSPADWRDHWIYFLLVDRFNNPDSLPKYPEPCEFYQGGNFAGILEKLPYLKKLGAGAIWLSPVLKNPGWFKRFWGGYGISDFLTIEPRYCKDPQAARQNTALADLELRNLVDEAHAHGLYVILDIVLNHAGDLFNYEGMLDAAPWSNNEYKIYWRDEDGTAKGEWSDIGSISNLPYEAGIWPEEFQRNDYFRRKGRHDNSNQPYQGDFDSLKEMVTEYKIPDKTAFPVRDLLIRAYQYLMAKFDIDGYRIDTLQYIEPEFARVFGNAMREYALTIGKKNFFTFGEIWQDNDESKIAEFIGRNTVDDEQFVGVDAAIDFPVRRRLVSIIKGFMPPSELASHYDYRRSILKNIVSSHGEAGRYYVTFIDNHDLTERFHNPSYPEQTKVALALLMSLQGIPCVYYGTEQGLSGHGDVREYVREALWGINNAFSENHEIYKAIQELTQLRNENPELRYGRQYFRPCSGNGVDFGYSEYNGGIIAFSRILNNSEVLVVGNTNVNVSQSIFVAVDMNLHSLNKQWKIIYSNHVQPKEPKPTSLQGSCKCTFVTLSPMEVQILK